MKNRFNPLAFVVVTLSALSAPVKAADQYWNPSPLTGNWADSVWSATSGGGSLTTWTAANNAIFDQAGTYTATIDAAQTATNVDIKAGIVTFAGTNGVSATNITIDSGATLSGAGDRYLKVGTTILTVNGTLTQTAAASGSTRRVSIAGGNGSIVLAGGFRTSGNFNFAGDISGTGSITTDAAGTFTLSGNNTYAGDTLFRHSNIIRVGSSTALSANSLLRFGAGTNIIELTGANFSRTVGGSAGNVRFHAGADGAGSSGFAAVNAERTVALNGTVSWGAGLFNPTVFHLGSAASTHKVTLTTGINLNAGTRTINTTNGDAAIEAEISGSLSGTGASNLTKTGTGVLLLSNENTYAGATTISEGTLRIADVKALGLIGGGTTVASGATLALSGVLAVGEETLSLAGNGVGDVGAIQSISGVNSMSGAVTLTGATRIGVEADTLEMSGAFSGTQALTAVGAGKLILSGGGTFGQMIVGNSSVASGGNLEWKAGTGTTVGNYFGIGDNISAQFTMSGGSLTVSPTNSLFVGSFSTSAVTGTLNVTGGTFALGTNVAVYIGGGGYNGNVSGSGILNISTGTFSTGTTTGTFRMGANATSQTGNGEINLSGSGILETARSITKGAQGTATVNFDGGTYKLTATQATMFGAGVVTNVKAGGVKIDTNTFNGTIGTTLAAGSPSGGLTKLGAGTLTLGGTNSYTGVTTISAGTISVAALGDGGVSGNLGAAPDAASNLVFGGGTLQISAAGTASSNRGFTINAASSATFNVSSASGALTLTGSVPTTTGVLYKTGLGSLTLDPGAVSQSLGAISANGGELILKSGTYATTVKDPSQAAYNIGAGARGGTLTIDGATLNVGGGNNLKIAAAANGNLSIKSGTVTSTELVIGHNGIGGATQSGGTVTTTNLYHQDGGVGSSYTLTGGDLTARRIYNNTAGAHDFTLNLSGGTLKSAAATTNLIDNNNIGTQITVLLGVGNTIIDTTDSNATIVRPMGDMPSVAGTFTKAGVNSLTLTAENTYTGGTTVAAGTLLVNNTTGSGTGAGAVNVTGTALGSIVATLGGTGTVDGAVTIGALGTLSPTAQASGSSLSLGSTLDFTTGSIFNWDLSADASDPVTKTEQGNYGQVAVTGAASGTAVFNIALLGGAGKTSSYADAFWDTNKTWNNLFASDGMTDLSTLFTSFTGAGLTPSGSGGTAIATAADRGHFSFNGSTTLTWTAVPEPTSALAGILLAFGLLRRRR